MKSEQDLKWFDSLGRRDFENGATLEEIRAVFKRCADLEQELAEAVELVEWLGCHGHAEGHKSTCEFCSCVDAFLAQHRKGVVE